MDIWIVGMYHVKTIVHSNSKTGDNGTCPVNRRLSGQFAEYLSHSNIKSFINYHDAMNMIHLKRKLSMAVVPRQFPFSYESAFNL